MWPRHRKNRSSLNRPDRGALETIHGASRDPARYPPPPTTRRSAAIPEDPSGELSFRASPGSEVDLQSEIDADLVAQMANGSIEAAMELYRRLSPIAYSLASQITGFGEDAEEVLIDSFHQAWAQADRYDPARATVTGWILSITRSRAIDQVRARRRWEQRKEKAAESVASFATTTPADPELEAIRKEERIRLQGVIDALPGDQRRAVELAYFAGMSHSEIAEHLGQPLGTVKTRLRLAMNKIRNAVAGVDVMEQ